MYSEIVDLSILIENNMIYYPGDPEPELSKYITLEKDGCQVMKLNIGTHYRNPYGCFFASQLQIRMELPLHIDFLGFR